MLEDIHSLRDLARLPLTPAEALREKPYRLLCVSLSRVKRVFTLYTGGTTGAPKTVFFTQGDLEGVSDYMGAALKTVARHGGILKDNFKVYLILPDAKPESQAKLLSMGIEKVGGMPFAADVALNSEEHMRVIERMKPDMLFGSTSRMYRITQEMRDKCGLGNLGVKVVFLTSEDAPQAMRLRIRELWNAEVFLHYGMTEMGFAGGTECRAHRGFHFNESDFIFEIVDPDTGCVLNEDKEGELVFTTLNREAMPIIRYKTGDLCRIEGGTCPCGANLKRLGPTVKRLGAMVAIKGGQIYPEMFNEVLFQNQQVIDFRVSLLKEKEKEKLSFEIEVLDTWPQAEAEVAKAISNIPAIKKSLDANFMAEPQIRMVERGELKRYGRSKRLIHHPDTTSS